VVPAQGEVWWAEAEDKRRPVLVVTRTEAVAVLSTIVVAPVSSTVRGIPTEIPLGSGEGLREGCAAAFDDLRPLRRSLLIERVGRLGPTRRSELCRALAALADC
jgi:mRNA interferase MazF